MLIRTGEVVVKPERTIAPWGDRPILARVLPRCGQVHLAAVRPRVIHYVQGEALAAGLGSEIPFAAGRIANAGKVPVLARRVARDAHGQLFGAAVVVDYVEGLGWAEVVVGQSVVG